MFLLCMMESCNHVTSGRREAAQRCCNSSCHCSRASLLAVLCAVVLTAHCLAAAAAYPPGTAVIRKLPAGEPDTQLLQAFKDPTITTILLASDYRVGSQFDNYAGPVSDGIPTIPIHRNITVSSMPGLAFPPMLDFQFKLSVLELCDTCWFTMHGIDVKDERMGANAQFDFFFGQGNSVVNATNVVRNRRSCTDSQTATKLVSRTKRAAPFPSLNNEQVVEVADLTWRGQLFPRTLHLMNYSVEFPRHYTGGYMVVLNNTWRLCHSYVDPACLNERDADMCVFQSIQSMLAAEHQHEPLSGGAIAGIVTGVVGAVVLAGAVAGVMCFRRQQHRRSYYSTKDSPVLPDLEAASQCCDVVASKDSSLDRAWRLPPKSGPGGSGGIVGSGSSGTRGQQDTTPPFQASGQQSMPDLPGSIASLNSNILCNLVTDLRFGCLLGTGSFGRVFKARLGDFDVAVKVIEHDSRMSAAVQNEVQLMLSCTHPNIVAAYHYVTHNHKRAATLGSDDRSGWYTTTQPSRLQCSGPGTGGSGMGLQGSLGSAEPSLGSNSSMDKPIPVLPGPKILTRKACPACDAEIWPGATAAQRTAGEGPGPGSSAAAAAAGAVTAAATSPAVSKGTRESPPCTCACSTPQEVQSGLLNPAWEREGGFWPAGPSALLEASDSTYDAEEGNLVTTWLIQEYCDAGTLGKQASTWTPATEDDAQMIKRLQLLQDVVKGLSYLHSKSIVHGDLNARNVMVTTCPSSPCGLTAKLADLGLARTIKQHNTHHTTCTVGTMSHMPPELLRHGRMSCAVDVYALGMLMYEVYTRDIAFRELHYGQFFETVVLRDQRPPVPASMPDDYRVLMEHCWSADPAARPSTKALQECIALMVADRQHSLGQPVSSSVNTVKSPQVVRQAPQAPAHGCSRNMSVQLAAQPHLQQQGPTPLRLPPHSQPQRAPSPCTLPVQPSQAQHHDQQQGADPHQHLRDACSQLPTSSRSLWSVSYDSSGPLLATSSSLGTSGSSKFAQEPCAAGKRMSAAAAAAPAPAGAPAAAGSAAEQDRATHADRSATPSQGFVRDL